MTTIRATFLACATILTSVFALLFYGYQQDQFIINTNGTFVSIFDRKSKSINICDKANCNLITPMFESRPVLAPQNQIIPQVNRGSHHMGNPQMEQHPMANPQMGQHPTGNPQMANPQMMGGNPQMMEQHPMVNPQMMGQVNPQMMGQINPQMMGPQMVSGIPGAQPQMMGGVPGANQAAAADEAAEEPEDAASTDTAATDTNAAASTDATADEPEEEAAPV